MLQPQPSIAMLDQNLTLTWKEIPEPHDGHFQSILVETWSW
jgi:hypothetical protein